MNGDVGQDLAVQFDVRGLEALDEAAVADAGVAAGGVETDDPQAAEFTLLLLAIAIGVLPRVLDGFFRVAIELGFDAEISLGVFQDFLAPLAGSGGVCCTSHVVFSFWLNRRRVGWEDHPPGVVDVMRSKRSETVGQTTLERRCMRC